MGVYQQLFDDEENRKMLEKAYAKIGMEEGRQQGLEEGRREGLEQGMEQGRTLERETIIKGMLSKNLSPETSPR
jgi:flagellar biosynthesis/type III secretory pathway protein FliH